MHALTIGHYKMVKRILCHVCGTTTLGINIYKSSTLDLYGFSDADWVGCLIARRSTIDFCTFLGGNCISWGVKKQSIVVCSSAEAEYRAMAFTAVELTWLSFILLDLGIPLPWPPILHYDNLSALYMTLNPVFHGRTKRIELDYHYVCERVALGALETCFVPSKHTNWQTFSPSLYPRHYSLI